MFTCKICKRDGLTTPADLPGGPICPRCADLLAQTAPRLLAACRAAEELLSRLWTPNAPTVAEIALLRGRLRAVIVVASRAEVVESAADAESWVDTGYVPQP